MNARVPVDLRSEVSAEIRRDIAKAKALASLAERDEELRDNVADDQDDTGKREVIYASSCHCSYSRLTQSVEPCHAHLMMEVEHGD